MEGAVTQAACVSAPRPKGRVGFLLLLLRRWEPQ